MFCLTWHWFLLITQTVLSLSIFIFYQKCSAFSFKEHARKYLFDFFLHFFCFLFVGNTKSLMNYLDLDDMIWQFDYMFMKCQISYYIKLCMLYVVCCMFWLRMHGYLLRNHRKLGNVVLHTDPKSATLGPRLIFISKFLEKAPFLAQNA